MPKLVMNMVDEVVEFYEHGRDPSNAGVDLYFPQDVTIPPGACAIVGMGVTCRMETYTCDTAGTPICSPFYLYPRSSIAKTPLILTNGVGVIDAGYRGEIKAALRNLDISKPYTIKRGERLVQICAHDLSEITVSRGDVQESETVRGGGGFGSTGK